MRYWPLHDDQGDYVREDGEIVIISEILQRDSSPELIYDETINIPRIVKKVMFPNPGLKYKK